MTVCGQQAFYIIMRTADIFSWPSVRPEPLHRLVGLSLPPSLEGDGGGAFPAYWQAGGRASYSCLTLMFLFAPLLLSLSSQSWGLAMGRSLLSSLLLDMKSEDKRRPWRITVQLHWGGAAPPLHPTTESLCSLPRTVSFFNHTTSPDSVLQSPSWRPWWILICSSFPHLQPKDPCRFVLNLMP